ncbi:class I SAM-dependent methyltransferase, partial [Caloranaerobacter ferrireducens]|uniref:class I SAM-dependent methyltransferase n=1 Tax=Caloranaerobacter ferrireducens TaxID=1323370 RepID=UPI00114CD841
LDRIYEAYYDGMGEEFGRKVRERIHWVCSQAKGEKILDIGCSQGIASILLAREGKKVLGIDLNNESIEFAKRVLEDELEITKKYVEFKTANFIDYDFKDEKFDSIIMAEILEHLTDPERFIKKASKLLNENGQVIITVPFGISGSINHKKIYYFSQLIKEVTPYLSIKDVKFFGEWVGIVAGFKNSDIKENNISMELLMELEECFGKV